MAPRLAPKRQGDLGEADAIAVLTRLGGEVCAPLFSAPDYDLVVDFGDGLQRVQVKTSTHSNDVGVFAVGLCTSGGNQSWNGVTRMFDRSRCDLLYALVADGRRWLIPATAVDGRRQIHVGGPKYSEYEIRTVAEGALESDAALEWAPLRGSAGVGEPGLTVNQVATPERVRIPPPPSSDALASLVSVGVKSSPIGRTRISTGHQMTIPIGPFRAAELAVGDRLEVLVQGPGTVLLQRVHPGGESVSAAKQPAFDLGQTESSPRPEEP